MQLDKFCLGGAKLVFYGLCSLNKEVEFLIWGDLVYSSSPKKTCWSTTVILPHWRLYLLAWLLKVSAKANFRTLGSFFFFLLSLMEHILQVTRDIYVLQHITVGLWRRSGSNGEGRKKNVDHFWITIVILPQCLCPRNCRASWSEELIKPNSCRSFFQSSSQQQVYQGKVIIALPLATCRHVLRVCFRR